MSLFSNLILLPTVSGFGPGDQLLLDHVICNQTWLLVAY